MIPLRSAWIGSARRQSLDLDTKNPQHPTITNNCSSSAMSLRIGKHRVIFHCLHHQHPAVMISRILLNLLLPLLHSLLCLKPYLPPPLSHLLVLLTWTTHSHNLHQVLNLNQKPLRILAKLHSHRIVHLLALVLAALTGSSLRRLSAINSCMIMSSFFLQSIFIKLIFCDIKLLYNFVQ